MSSCSTCPQAFWRSCFHSFFLQWLSCLDGWTSLRGADRRASLIERQSSLIFHSVLLKHPQFRPIFSPHCSLSFMLLESIYERHYKLNSNIMPTGQLCTGEGWGRGRRAPQCIGEAALGGGGGLYGREVESSMQAQTGTFKEHERLGGGVSTAWRRRRGRGRGGDMGGRLRGSAVQEQASRGNPRNLVYDCRG